MSFNKLPVLPESHPLYDWADWQSSRDALVSGTPTKHFAKEAWNAIVDDLSKALTNAGLEWDSKYTTAQGAKITVAYGKLTAEKFNSVRHNIDRPAPLGWAWAWNKNFRGYIGRENFNGRSTHGKKCDLVYPEYIIELVRKLNLLIEIMRETALLADIDSSCLPTVLVQPDLLVRPAAHVETDHISTMDQSVGLLVKPSASAETEHNSQLPLRLEIKAKISASTESRLIMPALVQAGGRSKEGLLVEAEPIVVPVRVYAEMEHNKCKETSADGVSKSQVESGLNMLPSSPVDAQVRGESSPQAEATCGEPLLLEGETTAQVSTESTALSIQGLVIDGSIKSTVKTRAYMRQGSAGEVKSSCPCTVQTAGELSTAWYPPVWVNGGLWIRQSHSVTQNENGELVIL